MTRMVPLIVLSLCACVEAEDPEKGPSETEPTDTGTTDSATTDPYGPDNAWYHAPDASEVPDEPESDAWTRGELPPNLQFTDQNGDPVSLYQFYGHQVYLDWAAEWCGPCNTWAPYLDDFANEYPDDVTVVTVLLEDVNAAAGDAAAVGRWVDEHASTIPVVWLDAEQLARVPPVNEYPTIYLLDSKLRLAQRSVNSLHGDPWIEQVVDRMEFAVGGSLDNDAEVCDDGYDDDLDLIADCMDDACASDAACATTEYPGSVAPCGYDPDLVTTTVDVWRVEVRGAVASIEADTVSAETGFENIVDVIPDGGDWADFRRVGDDEWDCTWPVEDYGCVRGWLRPGTWQVLVQPGTGGDEYDGDCVDPEVGEYVLRVQGDATFELVQDDVQLGDL